MSSTVLDFIYTILLVLVVSTQNSSREPVLTLSYAGLLSHMVIILVSRLKTAPGDDRLSSIQSCTVMEIDRSTLEPLVREIEPPESVISDVKGIV